MKESIQNLIKEMCLAYYDQKLVFGDKDAEKELLDESLMNKLDDYSFAQNKGDADEVEKVRYYWAYNMPCAVLVNKDTPSFWVDHLKPIYELLYKDILINVRTALASGFKEIINILPIDKMETDEEKEYFITVLNHFLKDNDETISQKVLPTLCTLVSKFPDDKKHELLDSLIKQKIEAIKSLKNRRDSMVLILE